MGPLGQRPMLQPRADLTLWNQRRGCNKQRSRSQGVVQGSQRMLAFGDGNLHRSGAGEQQAHGIDVRYRRGARVASSTSLEKRSCKCIHIFINILINYINTK